MKTVYLHVGAPKTGTTTLQYFLYENRNVLEEKGICYPDFQFPFPGIAFNRNAHFLIQRVYDHKKKRMRQEEKQIFETGFQKLEEFLENHDTVVLSEESIWNEKEMTTKKFEKIRKKLSDMNATLKVIVYLRRQDLLMPSYWAQLVKSRLTLSFEEFISSGSYKRYRVDYAKRLEEISTAIGKENVIVRVYEKQQFEGSNHTLISDFLHLFHLPLTEEFQITDSMRNARLQKRSLELKRILNQNPVYQDKKSFLIPLLEQIQFEKEITNFPVKEYYFSSEEQLSFLKLFEESNQQVAKEYLNRKDGILFKDTVAYTNQRATTYSYEELIFLCGEIIAKQEEEKQELLLQLKNNGTSNRIFSLFKRAAKKIKKFFYFL